MNLVSIIIPVYNTVEYLNECIGSVTCQTYESLEIIIVDDGSSDGSEKLCDSWAERDKRITVIHQPNQGLSVARNVGMTLTHGKYMLFLDSDDALEQEAIERFVAIMNEGKVGMVMSDFNYIDENGGHLDWGDRSFFVTDRIIGEREYWESQIVYEPSLTVTGKLFIKTLWDDIQFPAGKINEDVAVLPKLISRCGDISVSSYNAMKHRIHSKSIVHSPLTYKRMDAIAIFDGVLEYLQTLDIRSVSEFYLLTGMRIAGAVYDACDMSAEQKVDFRKNIKLFKKRICRVMKGAFFTKTGAKAVVFLISVPLFALLSRIATRRHGVS